MAPSVLVSCAIHAFFVEASASRPNIWVRREMQLFALSRFGTVRVGTAPYLADGEENHRCEYTLYEVRTRAPNVEKKRNFERRCFPFPVSIHSVHYLICSHSVFVIHCFGSSLITRLVENTFKSVSKSDS